MARGEKGGRQSLPHIANEKPRQASEFASVFRYTVQTLTLSPLGQGLSDVQLP